MERSCKIIEKLPKNKEKFKEKEKKESEVFKGHSELALPQYRTKMNAFIKNSKNVYIGDTYVNCYTTVPSPSSSAASSSLSSSSSVSSSSSSSASSSSLLIPTSTLSPSNNEMNFYGELKKRLKYQYKRNYAYMRSLFWKGKGYDYSIKDYFVEMKVERGDLMGYWKEGEKIELNKIFSNEEESQPVTILITGGPGYGKTTLCKKLAYDWSIEYSSNYLKHFDLVIFITLRELKEKSISDAIIDIIFENSKRKSVDEIKKDNLNFLIILDGYDEMHNKISLLEFFKSDWFKLFVNMTVLITSRPHFIDDIREEMEHRFSINGFERDNQIKYINLIFKNDENEIQSLIDQLNREKFLSDVAECPLMLHMLCCLHREKILFGINIMTDLYIKIFSLIIKRFSEKNKQYELKQGQYLEGEDLLIKLGELAWKYLQHAEKVTSDNLRKYFSDNKEYDFIVGLDILVPSPYIKGGEVFYLYEPLHRTFFEFLSSLYLYNNENNFNLIKNLIVKEEFIPETVFIFLCGFYGENPASMFYHEVKPYLGARTHSVILLQPSSKETKENDISFRSFCSPVGNIKFRCY